MSDNKKTVFQKVTVKFDAEGGFFTDGETLLIIEVELNSTLDKPTFPKKEGYVLNGWIRETHEAWNFLADKVTAPITLHAKWDSVKSNGIVYKEIENGYEVSEYTGKNINVVIPSRYNTKPVISIGEGAFLNNQVISKIVLPETIEEIHDQSFYGCEFLERVNITKNVKTIGPQVFMNCNNLQELIVDEQNETFKVIEGSLYNKETKTLIYGKSTNIPEWVETIADYAFCNQKITTIVLPENLQTIGSYAFYNCTDLQEITLPETLTEIGIASFMNCSSLKEIIIPMNVKLISSNLFAKCNNLEKVTIEANVQTIGSSAFDGCVMLQEIKIPNGLLVVREKAFFGCNSITIPTSVKTISFTNLSTWKIKTINYLGTQEQWNLISLVDESDFLDNIEINCLES